MVRQEPNIFHISEWKKCQFQPRRLDFQIWTIFSVFATFFLWWPEFCYGVGRSIVTSLYAIKDLCQGFPIFPLMCIMISWHSGMILLWDSALLFLWCTRVVLFPWNSVGQPSSNLWIGPLSKCVFQTSWKCLLFLDILWIYSAYTACPSFVNSSIWCRKVLLLAFIWWPLES